VENLVVERDELERFVSWLPDLQEHQAYLVQLMIRSRGLKEKYGFKGTDHVLMFKAVHGYLRATTPDGRIYWRVRLENEILRLGLLGARGEWEYANYEPGSRDRIRYLLRVPWELTAIYINVNPADALKAAQLTVNEVVDALYNMARTTGLARFQEFFRRPDQRYYANLARSTKTRFHSIDLDTLELFMQAINMFHNTFGYMPPRILTHRGGHILVDLEHLKEKGLERRYFGPLDKEIQQLANWYNSNMRNPRTDKKKLDEAKKKLLKYASDNTKPFYHRMKIMSIIFRDEKGAPLVEVKKQALEPVPGTIYKGIVPVKFFPEEV